MDLAATIRLGLSHGVVRAIIIALALAFYVYYGIFKMLYVHFDLMGVDILSGCVAARNFFEGKNIYEMPGSRTPLWYPPLAVTIFVPLCMFGNQIAKIIWFIVTHIIVLSSAWFTFKSCSAQNRDHAVLSTVIAFGFSMPLQGLIFSGNIYLLFILGLSAAFYALIARKNYVCAGIFGVLTWLKLYPALLMLPFAWNSRWQEVRRYAMVVTGLSAPSLLLFGFTAHIYFIEQLPEISRFVGPTAAMSFMFVLKQFIGSDYRTLAILANGIFLLVLLVLCWIRSKGVAISERGGGTIVVDIVILMTVIMLAMPSSWLHYFSYLVVPQSFIVFLWLQDRCKFKAMAVFVLLVGLINMWEIITYQVPIPPVNLSIYEIGRRRDEFPVLYSWLYAIPFMLASGILAWLLLNYNELHRGARSLELQRSKTVQR